MPLADTPTSMPKLVLVTGANGYIPSMMVKTLLEQGYKVRGTVRDPTNDTKTSDLKSLPNADTHLELVKLELMDPEEAFIAAMQGVEWCFHMSAPVKLQKQKDENSMIQPTLQGTLSMLRAAQQTPTVKKFILTSSSAAIEAGHPSPRERPFTEDDWSNLDGKNVITYDKCKTLAEKAAWEFMQKENPHFTLSAINPTFVIGPVASSRVGSSTELISRPMKAADPGSVNLWLQLVDVRDVVQAHINAARFEEAAGKRFILSNFDDGEMFMPEMVAILKKEFEPMGYKLRTRILPKWSVWLMSLFDAEVASLYYLLNDDTRHFDNTNSKEILKLEYRPVKETIIEGAHSMIEYGLIETKKGYKKPK